MSFAGVGTQHQGRASRSRCVCRVTPGRVADVRSAQDSEFAQLISPVPLDVIGGSGRARSASDAGVLRRKGRLKEQDQLIDFIVGMHKTHTCEESMIKMERWIQVCSRNLLSTSGVFELGVQLQACIVAHDQAQRPSHSGPHMRKNGKFALQFVCLIPLDPCEQTRSWSVSCRVQTCLQTSDTVRQCHSCLWRSRQAVAVLHAAACTHWERGSG